MTEQTIPIDGGQLHVSFDDAGAQLSKFATKTEDGKDFPAGDFALVPDLEKPSTWKLRLTSTPGGPHDPLLLEAAGLDLGKGKEYELKEIKGIEIFRAGTWNGDSYTIADLDEMVGNFDQVGFRPPVKLGHREISGGKAFGWVKALRRVGDRLVADFQDIPEKLFQKIKDRAFDTVSSEIFWNMVRNGQKFKRVLKAVALLGAETPAVSGLKPIRESFTEDELRTVHVYTLQQEDFDMADTTQLDELQKELKKFHDSDVKLRSEIEALKKKSGDDDLILQMKSMKDRQDDLIKELSETKEASRRALVQSKLDQLRVPAFKDHLLALYQFISSEPKKTVKFSTLDEKGNPVERDTPFIAILDDLVDRINKTSEYLFREHSTVGDWKRDNVSDNEDPGEAVNRLTRVYMQKHDKSDYGAAMEAVLSDPENAELKARYARV